MLKSANKAVAAKVTKAWGAYLDRRVGVFCSRYVRPYNPFERGPRPARRMPAFTHSDGHDEACRWTLRANKWDRQQRSAPEAAGIYPDFYWYEGLVPAHIRAGGYVEVTFRKRRRRPVLAQFDTAIYPRIDAGGAAVAAISDAQAQSAHLEVADGWHDGDRIHNNPRCGSEQPESSGFETSVGRMPPPPLRIECTVSVRDCHRSNRIFDVNTVWHENRDSAYVLAQRSEEPDGECPGRDEP